MNMNADINQTLIEAHGWYEGFNVFLERDADLYLCLLYDKDLHKHPAQHFKVIRPRRDVMNDDSIDI